ncbi:MAG: dihydropteroate synthase [Thermicanus sp.]|nr:dihydropteroate synthase [Thermicanus sp.]
MLENKGEDSPSPQTNALLMGRNGEYMELVQKLKNQPFGLKRLGVEVMELLQKEKEYGRILEMPLPHGASPLIIGRKTLIMGILNVTPDSFSDGGRYNTLEKAIAHAEELVEAGADIIDVGGESTRPGYEKVAEEEELKRVIPVIEELSKRISLPISIDTYKAAVAKKAIEAGAHIINDVWGAKGDPHMPVVVAESKAPVILMHNRKARNYRDLIPDMLNDLRVSIDLILAAGGKEEQIIIDPGIGFAKDYEENLTVMHHLREFSSLGYPILLGTSRKSMIGKTLDLPVEERIEGTIATVVYGIEQGAEIVRVHDVKEVARAVRMTDAMVRRGWRHG